MSVCILEGKDNQAVFYCSTAGWAFGPLMGSADEAEAFLQFVSGDPRSYSDSELEGYYSLFKKQYVCECGDVADGNPKLKDEEEDYAPTFGYPRTDGERFVCNYCAKKAKIA